jgi:putative SOS response-associated peptidase YedK
MCGRFTLQVPDPVEIAELLGAAIDPEALASYRPRYNIAPTDAHLVVRLKGGAREMVNAAWGLVPRWLREEEARTKRPPAFNARAETVRTTAMYRDAFLRGRCVVPADGFYEWSKARARGRSRKHGPPEPPLWFHRPDGSPLFFAGLYTSWIDPRSERRVRTFTIVTTPANDVVATVHDRMPAILAPEAIGPWLGASGPRSSTEDREALLREADAAFAALAPAPNDWLVHSAVSSRVNSVANDDPGCLEPDPPPAQRTLFD